MERTEYASNGIKKSPYPFDRGHVVQVHSPNHLDADWFPMIFSLPDVCESKSSVVRGVIAQFQAGEDLRSTEQGVDQKSGPWVPQRTQVFRPLGYGLTTQDVKQWEGIWQGEVPCETFPPIQSLPLWIDPSEKPYSLISRRRSMIHDCRLAGGYSNLRDKCDRRAVSPPPAE